MSWTRQCRPPSSTRTYAERVVERFHRCSEPTRDLLAAAAVLGTDAASLRTIIRVAATIIDGRSAVEEALRFGLLRTAATSTPVTVSFDHPLTRAAIYHDLSDIERRRLHASAATRQPDPEPPQSTASRPQPGRRASPRTSRRSAAASYEAGDWTAAAADYLAAARMAHDHRLALDHRWRAVECWLEAGDIHQAVSLAARVPAVHGARHLYIEARLSAAMGRFAEAEQQLRVAWAEQPQGETGLQLRRTIAHQLAQLLLLHGRASEAKVWGERALGADPHPGVHR